MNESSRPGGFARLKKGKWRGPWRPHGMTKQIIDVLKERREQKRKQGEDPPPIDKKGAKQLAHAIYDAIGDMLPRATEVRDFLEELARLYAKEGKPLRWTTLAGLPVINRYHEPEIEPIPVPLNGRRRRFNFVVGHKEDIDAKKAANAVTANFVHSVDATHLQAVAIEAAAGGIDMVCVHDCFGCIAPHAWRLKLAIHVKFVQLHQHNLLAEVLQSARAAPPKSTKLPRLPETGTLKLERMYLIYHAFKN
jgi:DNA-directed RNA polymerase, mitochondrial